MHAYINVGSECRHRWLNVYNDAIDIYMYSIGECIDVCINQCIWRVTIYDRGTVGSNMYDRRRRSVDKYLDRKGLLTHTSKVLQPWGIYLIKFFMNKLLRLCVSRTIKVKY